MKSNDNKDNKKNLSKRLIWRSIGLLATTLCLIFFIIGWIELRHDVENKNKEKENIDVCIEVKGQSIYIDDDEVYRFLPVPGGTISVSDSSGTRMLSVETFLLGEIPVSNRLQYYVVDSAKVSDKVADKYMSFPGYEGTLEQWNNFIEKLNKITGHKFRLPTNDEWEYAARGGKSTSNYKYAGSNDIEKVAYYKDNCAGRDAFALKCQLPNELGFYDMSGGLWEITSTRIIDVFPNIKQLVTMILMNPEQNPEMTENAKKYETACICRGGGYDSSAKECELNYRSSMIRHQTGARLVMEY